MSLYTIFSHHLLKSISLKSFVQERKPKRVYQTMKEDFRYHFSKKDYKYVLTLSTTFSFPGSCPKVSFEGLAITDNETSKRLNTYQQVLFLFLPQFPLWQAKNKIKHKIKQVNKFKVILESATSKVYSHCRIIKQKNFMEPMTPIKIFTTIFTFSSHNSSVLICCVSLFCSPLD